jgi:hypothetical protein
MVSVPIEMQPQGWSLMIASWTTPLASLFVRVVQASMAQTVTFQVYSYSGFMSDFVYELANRNNFRVATSNM